MSEQTWNPSTGRNFGLVAEPVPPAVANCKRVGHKPDSFVLTTERGSEERFRCDLCRILWAEKIP